MLPPRAVTISAGGSRAKETQPWRMDDGNGSITQGLPPRREPPGTVRRGVRWRQPHTHRTHHARILERPLTLGVCPVGHTTPPWLHAAAERCDVLEAFDRDLAAVTYGAARSTSQPISQGQGQSRPPRVGAQPVTVPALHDSFASSWRRSNRKTKRPAGPTITSTKPDATSSDLRAAVPTLLQVEAKSTSALRGSLAPATASLPLPRSPAMARRADWQLPK